MTQQYSSLSFLSPVGWTLVMMYKRLTHSTFSLPLLLQEPHTFPATSSLPLNSLPSSTASCCIFFLNLLKCSPPIFPAWVPAVSCSLNDRCGGVKWNGHLHREKEIGPVNDTTFSGCQWQSCWSRLILFRNSGHASSRVWHDKVVVSMRGQLVLLLPFALAACDTWVLHFYVRSLLTFS